MRRPVMWISSLVLAVVGCGGSDDSASELGCIAFRTPDPEFHADMVPLSSLNLDIPDELGIDLPVPADVALIGSVVDDEADTIEVSFATGATAEQLEYYSSVFAGCAEGARAEVPGTGEVIWLGSEDGSTAAFVSYLEGQLVVTVGPR